MVMGSFYPEVFMLKKSAFRRLCCAFPAALLLFSCSLGMDPATHNSASVVLTVSLPENAITELPATSNAP